MRLRKGRISESALYRRENDVTTILGVGVSNWVLWAVMVLFIAIYFVVTERMNRREDEARNRGGDE
jgi:cytochrome c-type biogenesis protein CcmH/NrfF